METTTRLQGSATIVQIVGEINTPDVETFRNVLLEAFQNSAAELVLDASKMSYLNSAAVGELAAIQRRLKEAGRAPLVIRHPPPTIERLLRVTRLDTVLTVVRRSDGAAEPPKGGAS